MDIKKQRPTDFPKLDDPFVCPHCGFEGTIMDTYERTFYESDGRHTKGGTRFTCKCGWEGYGIEMIQRPFHEQDHPLAMRKGYLYLCPKCEQVLSKETIALS